MIKARLVPNTTGPALGRARRAIPGRIAVLVHTVLEQARSSIVERTPVGFSRTLRGGYQVTMTRIGPTSARGVLSNPTPYHDIRERGRRPGKRPPVAALIPWVGSKLGIPPGPEREQVAFAVARKIGRKGYRGAHMVRDGWREAETVISPMLAKMGYAIVQDIDR
jgi:hypothetical protein